MSAFYFLGGHEVKTRYMPFIIVKLFTLSLIIFDYLGYTSISPQNDQFVGVESHFAETAFKTSFIIYSVLQDSVDT